MKDPVWGVAVVESTATVGGAGHETVAAAVIGSVAAAAVGAVAGYVACVFA